RGAGGVGLVVFQHPQDGCRGMIYLHGLGQSLLDSQKGRIWQAAGPTKLIHDDNTAFDEALKEVIALGISASRSWRMVDNYLEASLPSPRGTGFGGSGAMVFYKEPDKKQKALSHYAEVLNTLGCHLTWCAGDPDATNILGTQARFRVFKTIKPNV